MINMNLIAEIRRRHLVSKESISAIARDLKLSRPTVRKHLQTEVEPIYQRQNQPTPKLGQFQVMLESWLAVEAQLPKAQRRTARRLFQGLQVEGYRGAYDSVQRFVKGWKADKAVSTSKQAFVPLIFAPGEACQFDWSHEQVELGGVIQTVKVAHFRLTYSRQMFIAAYPRETQEMVIDAHNRAFAFFGGVPQRMVYDNLKAVVETIFTGKERQFNRRFMALANHYLFEPVACTPASGWEKGQVENQVGNVREWLFTPLARFASFDTLNAWLETRCRELAQRKHPTMPACTIAEGFAQEQSSLRAITAPFDGYVEHMLRASSTCLVLLDRNRYSVPASFAGRVVSVRSTATQVRIVADGELIAEHARCFGRDQLIYDPWHYLPILEKKPGALRNGAPFREWDLPTAIQVVRDRLLKQPKGDRAFVELLLMAREVGLEPLEVACELALECGVITAAVVMNELRRLTAPVQPMALSLPEQLKLRVEPIADCHRYDHLRGEHYVH
ncbi:IS21 family transposase [Chitinimonas sp. BJB300]|uniref:IS21 family transposase n=1 Tax=Chitinimonas sp. BJB300 TaxID=1559339 RepID=UPI001111B6DE|nr:IS21 family transposase [Chitinimonas sp. BJB300]TSJ85910.1 IS21 family transposase [Chitinimonas sp. BJB300]